MRRSPSGNRVLAGGTAARMLWGLAINGVVFFTSLSIQDEAALDAMPVAPAPAIRPVSDS